MKKTGRPRDEKTIKAVKKYRKMGLSFRDISKLVGKNIKHVYQMVNYDSELSPDEQKPQEIHV